MLNLDVDLDLGDEWAWTPAHLTLPDAWVGHMPFAFWLIKALRPDTLVELGTHSGNSYFAFCQALSVFKPTCRAYAVDNWGGDAHAGHYGEDVFAQVSAVNARQYRRFSTLLRTSFDDARDYFPEGGIDLLHVDGLHTYEAVKHDFETWRSALSPRAVVLFHDTDVRERGFGVWRLWQELRSQYPAFEFSHSHGLGVLGVGLEQESALQALFALNDDTSAARRFRQRLAARGETFQRQLETEQLRSWLRQAGAETRAASDRLEAAEQALTHSRAALVAKEAEVSDLQTAQEESQAREAGLRAELVDRREQMAILEGHAHAKDDEIGQLRAEQRSRARLHESRMGQIAASYEAERMAAAIQLVQAREAIAAAVREQEKIRQDYVRSTSWRLTRPLRVAVRLARGGPAAFRPPPPALVAEPVAPERVEIMASTPIKTAMRRLLRLHLDAFLSCADRLVLPRAEQPAVSIVLVLYNQAELTLECLSSIIETLGAGDPSIEVVIVDNASMDATETLLDRVDGATLIRNSTNLHFLRAMNQAAAAARGETILMLNNDSRLLPGAVASALRTLRSAANIGAVGGRIILPDGTLQEAGSIIWQDGTCLGYGRGDAPDAALYMSPRDVDYCSGAFLLTWTSLWERLGGFDETFVPAYYEEVDFCVRLWRSGYRIVFDPAAAIVHYEFGSSALTGDALALQARNHSIFVARHADWLAGQHPAAPGNVVKARTARAANLTERPTSRPVEADAAIAIPFAFPSLDAKPPRIAVMCHVFHAEIAAELHHYLRAMPVPADLFVSTDTDAKRDEIAAVFADWTRGEFEVRIMPNRGRDIAPKLVGFADIYAGYDLVLHLHSKKSDHTELLAPWRSFIYKNLLGSPATVMSTLDMFARLPTLGMVAPLHFEAIRRWIGWNGNYNHARVLAERMGLELSPDQMLDFPSGSMFWARPAALRPLLDLHLGFDDFPKEGGEKDHTPAHAIERLFFHACEKSGHHWLKVADPTLYSSAAAIETVTSPADLDRFVAIHGMSLTNLAPIATRPGPAPDRAEITSAPRDRLQTRAL